MFKYRKIYTIGIDNFRINLFPVIPPPITNLNIAMRLADAIFLKYNVYTWVKVEREFLKLPLKQRIQGNMFGIKMIKRLLKEVKENNV